ncbi:ABC transporter substrate-binding protein [Actinocorallia sp. A-T 12471]|uniref:ABC transporter substrate-binding protein n=1 Tax=Actinocorallia sp. A-T 12471 TaxID=3089813 RepID=UPI0029CEEC49|nr:ABC transporter substrate-binding protein [Actinocorallia sp. A-T 12471]MDX6740672.1 ABC transporter substrate-binding protein [Actinocorallia sp. A-T 12471]
MSPTRRTHGALAVLTGLTLFAASACGGTTADDGDAAGGTPKPGGALTFALQSPPLSANPRAFTDSASVYVTRQLFDSLVAQDPATGEIGPWLAERWEANADATAFTFHLRDGVTFSDGTPLTADVVKANFDDIIANRAKLNPAIAPSVANLTGAKADGDSVTVTFGKPSAPFLQAVSSPGLSIVGAASLKLPFEERADKAVGSGPFRLDAFGQSGATLSRRTGYAWQPAREERTGDAHLDKVEFTVIPESGVRTGSLQSGQVLAIGDVPPADVQALRDGGRQVIARPNPGLVLGLIPIQARPALSDANVRRAVALSIDAAEVRDTVLSPDFAPATSVLAKTTPGYADLSAQVRFDPAEAARLLDAAGWKRAGDGVREKDGQKLSLVVGWFPIYGFNQKVLELIKAQAAKVGIELELLEQTGAQLLDGLKNAKYDFFWTNATSADGDVLRATFSGAPPNFYRIADPGLEELLQRQIGESDPGVRDKTLAEIQQHVVDQGLYLPVFEPTALLAASPKVHGLAFTASSGLGGLRDTWLS